jgi:hypothetical protein
MVAPGGTLFVHSFVYSWMAPLFQQAKALAAILPGLPQGQANTAWGSEIEEIDL